MLLKCSLTVLRGYFYIFTEFDGHYRCLNLAKIRDTVPFTNHPLPLLECHDALGMENGAISDAQISASSQWDASHAPFQGRLHFKGHPKKQGSWSAAGNDRHPWLQIDLGSQYTRVTRIATQGRNSYNFYQWVTRYKLQYSNNEANFQFYREQGQTADKVK